jgi:hypothetical protein
LPSNSKTRLERVSKGKPSSLLGLVISDEGKKFHNIDTWCQWFEKLFSSSLRQMHKLFSVTGKNVWLSLILVIKEVSCPSGAYCTVGSWLN